MAEALGLAELAARIDALRELMDERDRSYIERFTASERNVVTAMSAAEKAVATAMTAQEKAVATAMAAAEKAVTKAEAAAEKRFDSVNEFRQTLADQQATFARTESVDIRFANLQKQFDELTKHRAASSWVWLGAVVVSIVAVASLVVNFTR